MRKWFWEMLAQLPILTFDASSFKMAETLYKIGPLSLIFSGPIVRDNLHGDCHKYLAEPNESRFNPHDWKGSLFVQERVFLPHQGHNHGSAPSSSTSAVCAESDQ
jgi:hypothetical protein